MEDIVLAREISKWLKAIMEQVELVEDFEGKAIPHFLEIGRLLVFGREKNLWKNISEEGNKLKTWSEFLESKTLKLGRKQLEKCIKAYNYQKQFKITNDKAREIGVEKMALAMTSRHPSAETMKPEHLKEHSVRDLKALQDGVRELVVQMSEEDYRIVEQALKTCMDNEKIDNRGKALYLICVDFLSGTGWHTDRNKTKQELMREAWVDFKQVKGWGKEQDKSYSRYARALESASKIAPESRKQGFEAISGWLEAQHLTWTLETLLKWFPDYETHPEKYRAEKSFQENLSKREEARK